MSKKQTKQTTPLRFNTLRKRLPHRYTVRIAEMLENITPVQVKCVFRGELVNPDVVKKVHAAATQLAAEYQGVMRLHKRQNTPKRA